MSQQHYTGQTEFIDDLPRYENEVMVGLVGAPVAAGAIVRINTEALANLDGVLGVFTAADFHEKHWGSIRKDQPFLVVDAIGYKHEPVCAIAATNPKVLAEAKRLVKVEVEAVAPVLNIREAWNKKQILVRGKTFTRGQVSSALDQSSHRHQGELEIGGQEHFYLEPQSCLVVPQDGKNLHVYSATQHPTETQQECALAAGLGFQQVICEVRRLGGAFGGKETQASHFAAIAAVVAKRLQRPARLVLSRDDDFRMTGKRHPFLADYDVGYDSRGRIQALRIFLLGDGGAYTDLSPSILDRALYHADGAYFLEHVEISGCIVRTNKPSNTAMRGFGGPQGNLAIENILEEISQRLTLSSASVRKQNLYGNVDRNLTPYGQVVENNQLHRLYERVMTLAAFETRRQEIEKMNQTRTNKVRGLSVAFSKFGISFTTKFLNQASSLVHLQTDGSAQIATGAVEMGQGVQVKMARILNRELGVPLEQIQVLSTSTEKNANTSPTAASSGADMNGMATLIACRKIKEDLIRLLDQWQALGEWQELGTVTRTPSADWIFAEGEALHRNGRKVLLAELFSKARLHRVSLSGMGFYKTPELDYKPFYYFTQGVCVTEVEIDELSGRVKVVSADIVMELGSSLDEKIDRGQIEGGFIQGMGWMLMEELYFDHSGELKTHSPSTYKIPLMTDLPGRMCVEIMDNVDFNKNIFNSKAVGEPPLLLSAAVWLAVKNAVHYRRTLPTLVVPATPENVLKALVGATKEMHGPLVIS
jgi:xanthine dehydrogenase large subunit